jgi:hypothetical protein
MLTDDWPLMADVNYSDIGLDQLYPVFLAFVAQYIYIVG